VQTTDCLSPEVMAAASTHAVKVKARADQRARAQCWAALILSHAQAPDPPDAALPHGKPTQA